jgi:hypothetical protein
MKKTQQQTWTKKMRNAHPPMGDKMDEGDAWQ